MVRLGLALLVTACLGSTAAFAQELTKKSTQNATQEDFCATFSWNVSHERTLFATPGTSVSAAASIKTAPTLIPEQLYLLQLLPQAQVQFPVVPGKASAANGSGAGAFAGVLALRITRGGAYRVSLDQAAWIDIVHDAQAIASTQFQARSGCHAPHKIVQFPLPADTTLLIQISAAPAAQLRLTITLAEASVD